MKQIDEETMSHESKITTDPEKIRRWAEERNGKPSVVKTTKGKNGGGILRINFPDFSGEDTLQEISWEEFFQILEKEDLAFLYQDELSSGAQSRFFKIVDRENAETHR